MVLLIEDEYVTQDDMETLEKIIKKEKYWNELADLYFQVLNNEVYKNELLWYIDITMELPLKWDSLLVFLSRFNPNNIMPLLESIFDWDNEWLESYITESEWKEHKKFEWIVIDSRQDKVREESRKQVAPLLEKTDSIMWDIDWTLKEKLSPDNYTKFLQLKEQEKKKYEYLNHL